MRYTCLAVGLVVAVSSIARAQTAFSGGTTLFDPEIRVVNSGALLDAQAVVSSDQRYVTITARPSVTQLVAMRQFPIALPPNLGYVGGSQLRAAADREKGRAGHVLPTPSALDRRGMIKVD